MEEIDNMYVVYGFTEMLGLLEILNEDLDYFDEKLYDKVMGVK